MAGLCKILLAIILLFPYTLPMLAYLLQGLSLGISAAASPGPFQAFLIGRSLNHGWRQALPIVLAPLISDGPIILAMVLLLTNLPPAFLRGIQIAGGLFVLYLAYKTFRTWQNFQPAQVEPDPNAAQKSLFSAVVVNFLSPGPYIFWSLVTGPVLVRGWRESPGHGAAFLLGFYLAMVGSLAALVILFGAARSLGPKVNRALIGLSAVALAGFGVYQLWGGVGPGG